MKDNAMRLGKVCLGNYKKEVDYQLRKFEEDLPSIDTSHVFVTDSSGMDGEDERIIEALKRKIPAENIHHTHTDCVVSSHCGPKTIGILYLLKNSRAQ